MLKAERFHRNDNAKCCLIVHALGLLNDILYWLSETLNWYDSLKVSYRVQQSCLQLHSSQSCLGLAVNNFALDLGSRRLQGKVCGTLLLVTRGFCGHVLNQSLTTLT